MKNKEEIKKMAREAIKIESDSIANLIDCVDDCFASVVELILNTKGRVIISGIGKSAIIAQKIVATLNSTGTPAIFMHAADAIHGDLGIIQPNDIVICLSRSGSSPEIKVLIPLIKRFGNPIVAFVAKTDSYLAQNADYIIHTKIEHEACPNNLAPTTSTTAQLVMGDALAVALLESRGFTADDFARCHPGGALGKQLYLKVKDLYVNNQRPVVRIDETIKRVIFEISSKCLGITAVVDEHDKFVGVITDGDLRRMLERNDNIASLYAVNIMTRTPKTIEEEALAISAFNKMKNNNITQLIVVDGDKYLGVVHIHDILREGIV